MILKKYGRLIITWDGASGYTCYVLNTPKIPVSVYDVQKLRESCLAGEMSCCEAFGIPDVRLANDPGVVFHQGMNGSFSLRFRHNPIEIKQCQDFVRMLERELRGAAINDPQDVAGKLKVSGGNEEDLITFFDLVEYMSDKKLCSRVNVLVYRGRISNPGDFDVTIDIDKGGPLFGSIPVTWNVFYDSSDPAIDCNPLMRKVSSNLRPLYSA